jgi:hypothetical protein
MSSIGRWEIVTERDREGHRTGVGALDLRATLRHLHDRGDRSASVLVDIEAGWVEVDLSKQEPWEAFGA